MAKKAKPGKSKRGPAGGKGAPPRPGKTAPREAQPPSRDRRRLRMAILAAGIAVAGAVAVYYLVMERGGALPAANLAAAKWAETYWQRPIPPQGVAPADYADPSKSLRPADCGSCHVAQYEGWKASLHGHAMGPGVMGQFPTLSEEAMQQCHDCHAPLSEQYARLPGAVSPNPTYDPALRNEGLVCAACHLRHHQRNGPPLREGRPSISQVIHGDPVRTPFFEASEFCKGCHQHPEGAMKVNGKPVENTYNEWLASPYAEQGVTCQQCHMPDRQHLWKGIHDKEMTRSGVTIESGIAPEAPHVGDALRARLTIRNTGTGHAFPSYTTPAVYLRAALLDANGDPLPGQYEQTILQRRLDMSSSPWGETFDTRLLPGQAAEVILDRTIPKGAVTLYLWVWVDPDQFYHDFFRGMLEEQTQFPGRDQIQAAFDTTEQRRYLLWSKRIPIAPGA